MPQNNSPPISSSLPTPKELKLKYPLSEKLAAHISSSRKTIEAIFDGRDDRFLLILGPCSIHDSGSSIAYAKRLLSLAKEVSSSCFLVMRTYFEKSRSGKGWRGFLHDPDLSGTFNVSRGIELTRALLVELTQMGVATAAEFVTPHLAPYFDDLLSWGSIGARTSSSQLHRLLASDLPMPIGIKNTVDGNIDCAVQGASLASYPHRITQINEEGRLCLKQSRGNPYAHVVLRGGGSGTNYDLKSVQHAVGKLRSVGLPDRVMVDCSHGNSQKVSSRQKEVFQSVIEQVKTGCPHIFGTMIESHLKSGVQRLERGAPFPEPEISLTDPCLGFEETADLILSACAHPISV